MKTFEIHQFIQKQGWSDFSIVDYLTVKENLQKHEGVFEKWIEKGFQADMHYLESMKDDRFHPEKKWPEMRSVIVLGAWYGHNPQRSILNSEWGVVARYAHGKDYHKVLRKKLIALSDFLKSGAVGKRNGAFVQMSNVETYVSIDSSPTVDRVLAESAGLGFFGKNCCIINPSKGSYFFIASILTTADLTSTLNRRMPNCGNCTKCAVACPTGALVGPGQLDARQCISYLTIENKGAIPIDLRPKIGNRLFGCDICQEVCPFNMGRSYKQEVLIENLKGEYGVGASLDLREVLSIETDEEYSAKFAGTPLMRAKRRGLIRNACVVAGNSGEKSLIPYLQRVIDREEEAMLKEHAKWAMDRLKS